MSGTVQVLSGIYAVVLVLIGVLEITQYRNPRFYPIFLIEPRDYDAVRMWTINIGGHNLVSVLGIVLGLLLYHAGYPGEGRALVLFSVGSHVILGAILVASERRLWLSGIGEALIPAIVLGLHFLT